MRGETALRRQWVEALAERRKGKTRHDEKLVRDSWKSQGTVSGESAGHEGEGAVLVSPKCEPLRVGG